MKEKRFIKLTPFKMQVLQSFPFIDEDFDAITNYELLCKVVEYLNITVDNVNLLESDFKTLYDYVHDYFDNLDVQEEINKKLDDMAESGELADIIAQYLNLAGVLGYNTVNDMKNATNLVNGSFARTYGLNTYNDGKGAFYKIRTITSSDDVDGINIVAVNFSETLIAEKMPDYYINELNNNIEDINDGLNLINSERTIIIGDSYSLDRRPDINITGWAIPLQNLLGLSNTDCYIIQDNGGGFTVQGSNGTFLEAITNLSVTNKDTIKNIIICGGLNDIQANNADTIKTAISSFMSYVKNNYPNAKVYIGMIGWNLDDNHTSDNQIIRYYVLTKVLPAYQQCNEYGAIYLNGVENVMHDKTEYYDGAHPNQVMCDRLAHYIYQAFSNGYASVTYPEHTLSFNNTNITTDYFSIRERIINNETVIFDNNEYGNSIIFTSDYPTIANYTCYVGELNSNYISNTYTYDELFTCPCIVKDIDNTPYQCIATAFITSYNFLHIRFYNNTNVENKQIKEINLLSPYSSKPTITH